MSATRRALALAAALATCAVLGAGTAHAQQDCERLPDPTGYVVDEAGVVDDAAERDISARLAAFEASSGGTQVAALVVSSIGDDDIADYANDVFDCWGIGEEGGDTGVLLVVAMEQRRLRIEVGRGLEGDLTDVEAADVVRDVVAPRMRAGDVSAGVRDGVLAIVRALGGDAGAPAPAPVASRPGGATGPGVGFLAVVAFVILASIMGRGRGGRGGPGAGGGIWPAMILGSMLGGGHRGGYGGGGGFGGGFGGGGGGFGGFGGGGSGGGGASGGW